MIGPGKYDEQCTKLRTELNAKGVVLFIIEGDKGNGMSCQCDTETMLVLPALLRDIADRFERDTFGTAIHSRMKARGDS